MPRSTKLLIYICLAMLSLSSQQVEVYARPAVPALYVFGDSLVDSGNGGSSVAYSLPYGRDFDTHRATGRFTNGRQVTDFLARYLKLGAYPPPFRANNLNAVTNPGLNFAIAGCGLRIETARRLVNVGASVETQVSAFISDAFPVLENNLGFRDSVAQHMRESIFFIWIGSNDWAVLAQDILSIGNEQPDLNDLSHSNTRDLLMLLEEQIERLYNIGARRFIIPQLHALGCTPLIMPTESSCYTPLNNAVQYYNTQLSALLKRYFYGDNKQLSGAQVLHPSFFKVTEDLVLNPQNDHDMVLQGKGPCITSRGVCADGDNYIFWDEEHFSQQVYRTLARIVWRASHKKKTWLIENCQDLLKAPVS